MVNFCPTFRFARAACLSIAAAVFPSCLSVHAEELTSLVVQSPSVAAARQQWIAVQSRTGYAGRWSDPQFEGMVGRKDTPADDMPMWGVTLRQPLPKYGERAADRARAEAAQQMAEAEFHRMAGETAAEAARALAEGEASRNRIRVLQRQVECIERALAALDARLAAGQGRLSETFALQSRATRLRLEMEKEQAMAEEADRETRTVLGLPPEALLPPFTAPEPSSIRHETVPSLTLLNAKLAEAKALADMARASAHPMTAVGVFFEREEDEMGDEDTVGVAIMTELPFNNRRAARLETKAAMAEADGWTAEIDATARRVESDQLREERLGRLAERTRTSVAENQDRLDREYDTWLAAAGSAFGSDMPSVLILLDLIERGTDLSLQSIEAELAHRLALADLWRHTVFIEGE